VVGDPHGKIVPHFSYGQFQPLRISVLSPFLSFHVLCREHGVKDFKGKKTEEFLPFLSILLSFLSFI